MGVESGSRMGGHGGRMGGPIIGGGVKKATSTSNVAASCGPGGLGTSGGGGGGSIRVNLHKNKIPTQGQHTDYATSTTGLQGEGTVCVIRVLCAWRICMGSKGGLIYIYLLRFHRRRRR